MYSNAQYHNSLTKQPESIQVDINGVRSFVPISPSNSDYVAIMQLVESGQLTIAPAP